MNTIDEINAVRAYFDTIESYITEAKAHAQKFNFGLVSVVISNYYNGYSEINQTTGTDLNLFTAGIGDTSIGS